MDTKWNIFQTEPKQCCRSAMWNRIHLFTSTRMRIRIQGAKPMHIRADPDTIGHKSCLFVTFGQLLLDPYPLRIRIQESQINANPDPQHCYWKVLCTRDTWIESSEGKATAVSGQRTPRLQPVVQPPVNIAVHILYTGGGQWLIWPAAELKPAPAMNIYPARPRPKLPLHQCCGSRIFIQDRNRIFSIPDLGWASKNLSILTQKIVSNLSEIWSGLFIPDPDPDSLPAPGSWGQKSTGSRIRKTPPIFLASHECHTHSRPSSKPPSVLQIKGVMCDDKSFLSW